MCFYEGEKLERYDDDFLNAFRPKMLFIVRDISIVILDNNKTFFVDPLDVNINWQWRWAIWYQSSIVDYKNFLVSHEFKIFFTIL